MNSWRRDLGVCCVFTLGVVGNSILGRFCWVLPASLLRYSTSVPTHKTSLRPHLPCCLGTHENIFIFISCKICIQATIPHNKLEGCFNGKKVSIVLKLLGVCLIFLPCICFFKSGSHYVAQLAFKLLKFEVFLCGWGLQACTIMSSLCYIIHIKMQGSGETAQWLRVLTVLAEDLGSIPRIHRAARNHL